MADVLQNEEDRNLHSRPPNPNTQLLQLFVSTDYLICFIVVTMAETTNDPVNTCR